MPTTTPRRTRSLKPSLDWLLVLVPLAIVLGIAGGPDLAIFLTSAPFVAPALVFMLSVDGRSNWLEGAS